MKNKFFNKALSVFTAMAMALSLMTGIPFSELGLGIIVSAADAATVGAFEVTGGVLYTDYAYAGDVLTIYTSTPLTIKNTTPSTPTTDRIEVALGISANITLAGVNIDVSSQNDTAAFKIADGSAGNVTITLADGTTNTLKSGEDCAGLQKNGEYSETLGKLTITGTGTLTAQGGDLGAGIGGGKGGNGSYIEISGGVVTATGGMGSAGIGGGGNFGGGISGSGSYIEISGGVVTATGGGYGAGIGGGGNFGGVISGSGSYIEISGGVVTATGVDGGAGIGGGADGSADNIKISGGSVKASSIGCIPTDGTANVTPVHPLEFDVDGTSAVTINGKAYPTKHIDENKLYVYLPAGIYTVANGNSQIIYTIADDGDVSEVVVGTAFTITGTALVYGTDYTYPADTGVLTILSGKAMTIANVNPNTATTDTIVVADGVSANITLAGVNIDVLATWNACAFKIANDSTGNVTITLADGTTNTLKSGNFCAGLQKNGEYISETQGKLTITGTGSLSAQGSNGAAGVGGGSEADGSNITISGGTVTAQGGAGGAGIGGGSNGIGSYITISGGTVTATGGDRAAGIGSGSGSSGSNIEISGGTVTATGGDRAAGIGGGSGGSGSNIEISGGTVTAEGGANGAGIGGGKSGSADNITISGGSVKASSIGCTPTDGTANVTPVYLLGLDVDGTSAVTINGKAYPKKHFDENKVYIYLPAKTAQTPNEVTVGNETTKYCYINAKWLKVVDSPEADDTEFTYDGTEKTYTLAESENYTITGNTAQTTAGTYTVTVALNDKDNTVWNDGTTDDKTFTFTIAKATVTVTAKSYTIKVGEALPTYAYDVTGLVNDETLPIDVTISCNAADSNTAGTYTITVSGAANSTNYTFSYVNGTLTISNKSEQTITASDVTLTYGETGKKIIATTSGDGAISYSTTSDVISVAADGTITALKAGTATVTINVAETDTYAAATKTVTVTVNKAAVTVTAKSYTIKVGEALPTYAYDVAGLVNGETLPIDVTISCTADGKTAGAFDIVVSGATTSTNYTYTYVNGTLTVSEKEVVAAPTFTPASGTTFTSSQKVTISCATAGATIYYTTDGSTPTTASTKYTGAITITSTTTIKAIAVKDGMTDSAVVTAKYTKNSGGSGGSGGGSGGGGGYRPPVVPDDDDDDNDDVVVNDPEDNEDKSDNGNGPQIKGDNGKTGWDAILDELDDADEGDKIVVDMNGETEVPEDVFEQIKGQDIDLVIELDNGFIWTINGKDVTNPADIDLGVNKGSTIPVRAINAVTGECEYITITLAHNGEFGFKAVLTVDMGVKNEGYFANLYWYTDNDTKFICADKIDNKGRANLVFTHASEYVIVIDENDHTPEDDVSAGAGIEEDSSEIPDDFDNDENPYTGVAISFAGIIISAATIMIARKRKKQ